jgi:hypothetical protein
LKARKNGGSHVVIQRDGCPLEVCVPARKPIKAVYVLQLLALIVRADTNLTHWVNLASAPTPLGRKFIPFGQQESLS